MSTKGALQELGYTKGEQSLFNIYVEVVLEAWRSSDRGDHEQCLELIKNIPAEVKRSGVVREANRRKCDAAYMEYKS